MKITITWKTCAEISPDEYSSYTKVVHCEEQETLKQVYDRLTRGWEQQNFDAEIHFEG